jgi:hypothetical protein
MYGSGGGISTYQNQSQQHHQYQHRYKKQGSGSFPGDQLRSRTNRQQRNDAINRAIDNSLDTAN